ncbi:MAG: M4 family metallopeptidase [Oligoflexales bacterium]|nr:M4 family metallopeptidase [Oligoflexales bacterium]
MKYPFPSARIWIICTLLLFTGCSKEKNYSLLSGSARPYGLTVFTPDGKTRYPELKVPIEEEGEGQGKDTQGLASWLAAHQELFNVSSPNPVELKLERISRDRFGGSILFSQQFQNIRIDAAELLVILDRDGEASALNSSLISPPQGEGFQDELDANEAFDIILRELGLDTASSLVDSRSLIVRHEGGFHIAREIQIKGNISPIKVTIFTGGVFKGKIHSVMSLDSSLSPKIKIYSAAYIPVPPTRKVTGTLILNNGEESLDVRNARKLGIELVTPEVRGAMRNFETTGNFYESRFGLNGFDGQGSDIVVSVDLSKKLSISLFGLTQNAAWSGAERLFMFGAGGSKLAGFARALDVVAHEFTHAVITYSSNLNYRSQSGALNEHFADVFGEIIESIGRPDYYRPFLIGESILRNDFLQKAEALRDMKDPHRGLVWQPENVSEIAPELQSGCVPKMGNDNCGVHILSGIPNRAAARIIEELGTEKASPLLYRVMTARLRPSSDFADYQRQMVSACPEFLTEDECRGVGEAFTIVGIHE